jgi:DNA-binding SARP family transcriptional activator
VPEFRVLGPLTVLADDGEPLALGGQNPRAVLALLLLRANHVVSTELLVDALWGEAPPRTATTSLHNAISALRKLLGPRVVETRPPGYRLVVDAESFDLLRFEALVAAARTLEPAERADRLREALALWRGEPLADLPLDAFEGEVRRLQELRLVTLEDRIEADLECERYADLVPELEALVARDLTREGVTRLLMLALYHSGRQTEALRAYQDLRRALVDVYGIEPSPQLQELHAQILSQTVPRPRVVAPAGETHFADVAGALLAGRLVPLLGTSTRTIADRLAERFEYPDESRELPRVAQYVALTQGDGPLQHELSELLAAPAEPTAVHRFFAALPALLRERGLPHQLLVTTTYDDALEQALHDAGEEYDVVTYVASGRDRGRFSHRDPSGETRVIDIPNTYATELSLERRTIVLKLHGGIGQDGVVVTEDDYIGYLGRGDVGTAVPVGLAARLRRSHFLFLGYGLREWGLRLVLDRMSGGEPLTYRSWAVLPEAVPLDRDFWRWRKIDLIEQPLGEYVEGLGAHIGLEVTA